MTDESHIDAGTEAIVDRGSLYNQMRRSFLAKTVKITSVYRALFRPIRSGHDFRLSGIRTSIGLLSRPRSGSEK
jgi:hypothetical protein